MTRQMAKSQEAQAAFAVVCDLQTKLVATLQSLRPGTPGQPFEEASWLRARGIHGGGTRFMATDRELFNRASANISQVQYEDDPQKSLGSASALSAIVHPRHPQAPSLHIHVSWTEPKKSRGYWRIMADLNPSHPHLEDTRAFESALAQASGHLYEEGRDQGQQYFYIPALGRHRGVAHFYLEEFSSGDLLRDRTLAQTFGQAVIQCYGQLVRGALARHPSLTADEERRQRDYHTLYFLQVLTLDRGTTSGLLVHDENDTGILGSLPSHVDRQLLLSWLPRHAPLPRDLLTRIIQTLPEVEYPLIDDPIKVRLAHTLRLFYGEHPEAQDLLARGRVVPPTVANHQISGR